ncbi:TPA: hypothetical protein N6X18_001970 [Escherichia coli]|nr:hypothetical protein [Escherichia coli]
MSELNVVEGNQLLVVSELADLLRRQPLNQIQYDNLCRFMIYFSLAESKLAPMASGLGGTDELSRALIDINGVDKDAIDDCYAFFIRRYRDQPDSERRFRKLAPAEYVGARQMPRFAALLQTQTPTTEEKISFVFKVIFRLRHNLFHGEKWSYNLEGQDDNFSHAACVLLSTLNLTRGSMWQP